MATCSKCRAAGEKLYFKGNKCRSPKCTLERRQSAPGQHGKRAGTKKFTEYGKQLDAKQKVKLMYNMREQQFRRFFGLASKMQGVTGENLLSLLERRLDNVIFRLKLAISRIQARQLVVHGHVTVNNHKVSSPSFLVKQGDVIGLTQSTLNNKMFVENVIDKRLATAVRVPEWLDLQKKERKGAIARLPLRSDITAPIEEHLIVELYSK